MPMYLDGISYRWHAIIFYRSDEGLVEVEHDFDELRDLHRIVERGPNFYAIDHIEVRINPGLVGHMTMQEAAIRDQP